MNLNPTKIPQDHLISHIRSAIEARTKEIVEEEGQKAAARVQERVRELAGMVATRIAQHVDYEQMSDRLIITVRTDAK